ncbi:MAG TPA: hypothetical protein VKB14_13310 [Actinomycetales bacterium]|nr:hypothetical protein [Actinomycetales bacterium]
MEGSGAAPGRSTSGVGVALTAEAVVVIQISGGSPDDGVEVQEVGPARAVGNPWTGRLLLAAALAALLGLAAWRQQSGPEPSPPVPPRPAQVDGAPLLTADTGTVGSGFVILTGGDRPVLVDPSDGSASPVRGLPSGGEIRSVARTAVGLVAVVVERDGSVGAGRLFRLDRAGRATSWGRGDVVQPAQDGDVLVLRRDSAGLETLASVTSGGTVRWQRQLPRLTQLIRSTPLGLVVQVVPDVRSHSDGDLLLIDPRGGAVRRRLGPVLRVLAVSDSTVAATRVGCAPDCPLLLIDLATGRQRALALPSDPVPATAAFSPDGSRLAVSTFGLAGEDAAAPGTGPDPHTGRVFVLDLSSGRSRQVPGLLTGRNQAADVAWAPGGAVLLLGVKWPTYERIARWHPASNRLRALPARLSGSHPPGSLSIQFDRTSSISKRTDPEKPPKKETSR